MSYIIHLHDKIECFQMKEGLWFSEPNGTNLNKSSLLEIKTHLLSLKELQRYFPDISTRTFHRLKLLSDLTLTKYQKFHRKNL
jgi:hypothetical protein